MPKRYLLAAGTFTLSVLLYVDRICISAAKTPITDELGLTEKQFGWILSAFTLGYALLQVPSGSLADRFGPRKILSGIIVLWSVFTGLTGMATKYFEMLAYRFLFGMSEAGAFPGIARASYAWMPMQERGIVNGINFSGSRIGGAAALFVMPTLIEALGWRTSFYFFAGAGILFSFGWFWWFRDDPREKSNISPEELEFILANRQSGQQTDEPAMRLTGTDLFGSLNMWLAMAQYFASNFTFFFSLGWAYPFIKERFDLPPVQAGMLAAVPLLCGAFGNWFAGWLLDRIYKAGNWRRSRRLPAIIGFLLATFGISAFVFIENPYVAIVFLSIAIFGADMTLSPSWSFCMDIGKANSGVVSGTMNMAGNVGSFLTALAFPYMKEWAGSPQPYFLLAAGLNLMAVGCWWAMRPDQEIGAS